MNTWPRCRFAVRYPAGAGKWRFVTVSVPTPGGSVHVPLEYPPAIGDLVILMESLDGPLAGGPAFRVVDRMWTHSDYGSPSWPGGSMQPLSGPLLDIIVEPSEGLYADEQDTEPAS